MTQVGEGRGAGLGAGEGPQARWGAAVVGGGGVPDEVKRCIPLQGLGFRWTRKSPGHGHLQKLLFRLGSCSPAGGDLFTISRANWPVLPVLPQGWRHWSLRTCPDPNGDRHRCQAQMALAYEGKAVLPLVGGGGPGSPALHRVGFRGSALGEPPCVLSTPVPHSQSRRARAPRRPRSRSTRRMSCTAPWVWSGLRRSCRRLGPEGERSPAAAMGRKTLNVSGQCGGGRGGRWGWTIQQGRGCGPCGTWGGAGHTVPARSHAPSSSVDHRQSSHHIHHPLSAHLPPDTRRRKTPQGLGRKPRRRPGASPTGETPTIEEGEEDEDEASEAEGARALTQPSPASTPSSVQVSGRRAPGRGGLRCPEPSLTCAHGFLFQFFLQEDEAADRKAERTSPSLPPALPHQEGAPRASRGAQTG